MIACRQKLFLWAFLAAIATILPTTVALRYEPLVLPATCFALLVCGVLAWSAYQLARALGWWVAVALCFAALQFIPLGTVLTAVVASGAATYRLQGAGVHVGMLGADLSRVP